MNWNPVSNFIHPTAIVEDNVVIGSNNFIGPYCHISGPVVIGDNNYFDSFVSIGSPPQDDMLTLENHISYLQGTNIFTGGETLIRIGSRNFFREYVTVHKPILSLTEVGNDCYFMTQSHVPHDALIHDRVKVANSTQIGGFSVIQSDAYLGLASTILQFSVIGAMTMIGMNSSVSRHIFPGSMVAGSPAKTVGANFVKLNRYFGEGRWWQDARDGNSNESIPPEFLSILSEYGHLRTMNAQRKTDFESMRKVFKNK